MTAAERAAQIDRLAQHGYRCVAEGPDTTCWRPSEGSIFIRLPAHQRTWIFS